MGKTYFADMFENYLLGFDDINIQNENRDYAIIRFDAWKNDFWNNAFEPFAATVFENDMLYCDIETRNAGSLIGRLWIKNWRRENEQEISSFYKFYFF